MQLTVAIAGLEDALFGEITWSRSHTLIFCFAAPTSHVSSNPCPALRIVATYSYNRLGTDMTGGAITSNAIQIGAQAIFF